ncbi:flagellar motor protein MotB [Thiomicrorhabdus sp. zzn3]|uniref:OmpA/MotB family protein n=1 Tax=Thiomicrorhabdus sp. zzn3 TaxID=3039775 RepID=UPI0024365E91|nr:flagellar motor protein MotB [Thiomicrorhabdus sp. zzn3]MDG6779127.1 flagellar motor protein MotB [Thiomicrorhabdus sp. zzn3]
MARRRGGHDDGGAHGGSWKIALADLMTVLMVFFLVMWLLAVVDPDERQIFVNRLIGEQASEPDSMIEQTASMPGTEFNPLELKPPVTEQEIFDTLKNVNPRDINIEDNEEFTKITLRSDSFFESGRATISDKTREQLELLGESLAGRGQPMVISGYTDDLPINNFQFPSNWELSAARAATVARTFIYMGVDKRLIKIEGNADNEPVVPNDSAYSRSMNRRVIIKIDKRQITEPFAAP